MKKKMSDKTLLSLAVKSSDYQKVAILFSDKTVTFLFSQLLQTRGVETNTIERIEQLTESEKIITELQYYKHLSQEAKQRCLVISSQIPQNRDGIFLTQPLTEAKVENALDKFLSL